MFEKAFFKYSQKTYMLGALSLLSAFGLYTFGFQNILPLSIAVLSAVLTEIAITKLRKQPFFLPSSAAITGLLVGLILNTSVPLYLPALISFAAILIKNFVQYKGKHIFNPASAALVPASFFSGLTWWGLQFSLPALILGLIVDFRIKRLHYMLSFLFVYALLLFASGITNSSLLLNNLQVYFPFAAFMLIEPVTAPVSSKARVFSGFLAAFLAFAIQRLVLPVDPLLLALLAVNLLTPLLNKYLQSNFSARFLNI